MLIETYVLSIWNSSEMVSGNEYQNSVPLDLSLCSDSSEITEFINRVVKASGHYNTNQFRKCLNILICNLYICEQCNPGYFIRYPRNKNTILYPNPHDIRIGTLIKAVNVLDGKYVENKKGFMNRVAGKGFISRMRMTQAMKEQLVKQDDLHNDLILQSIRRHPKEPVIIMRDENHRPIPYLMPAHIRESEKKLRYYNRLLASTELSYRDMVMLPCKQWIHRVFNNGSWKQGGRFYGGWWQHEVPSEERKLIQIAGQPTIELDYSGMQPRLLYAREGIDYGDDDPYTIPGRKQDRELLKVVLLIALNAHKGKDSAIKAIINKMNKEEKKKQRKIYTPEQKSKKYIEALIDDFEEMHSQIAKHLYSGIGLELQSIDSQIAENVMYNLAVKGILVLPVHDSFICSVEYKDILLKEMNDNYYAIANCYPIIKQVA